MFRSDRKPPGSAKRRERRPRVSLTSVLVLLVGLMANSSLSREAVTFLGMPIHARPDVTSAYLRAEIQLTHTVPVAYRVGFRPVNAGNHVLNPLMATREAPFTLTGKGAPDLVVGAAVEPGMFSRLSVKPILGRNFAPGDERARRPVVVLSERLWKRRFGADRQVVGKTIRLSNVDYTIIGIMPADFWFPFRSDPVELWMPERAIRDLRAAVV